MHRSIDIGKDIYIEEYQGRVANSELMLQGGKISDKVAAYALRKGNCKTQTIPDGG